MRKGFHLPLLSILRTKTPKYVSMFPKNKSALKELNLNKNQWWPSPLICITYHPQHYDVIKRKHFPRYWPFVRGIHRSPVNSPHKGQWRGALMFSLICVWINGWVNNRKAGDLGRYRAHYDVIVMNMLACWQITWSLLGATHDSPCMIKHITFPITTCNGQVTDLRRFY